MDDFQVEIACTIVEQGDGTNRRDVNLLERFGIELEEIAGEMGPATSLEGDRYVALMTISADSMLEAGELGIEAYNAAMARALESFGDELGNQLTLSSSAGGRLHVEQAEPVLL